MEVGERPEQLESRVAGGQARSRVHRVAHCSEVFALVERALLLAEIGAACDENLDELPDRAREHVLSDPFW
jgi:hypothetical protein